MLFLYEVFSSIYKNNLSVSGFSIGELVLDILIKLNSKNVYLIGLDFSLNQKTGDSHSSDSSSGITKLDLMMEQDREYFNSRESLIKVKGNLLGNVFTTPLFFNSIQSAEVILSHKSDNMNFFNLSENGAFIKNTIPLKINELNIKEFTNIPYYCINDDFLIFLNANSLNELSNESILSINNEILFLKNEISNLLNKIKNTKLFTFDELLKNIYQVYELTYDYKNINKIIENYFKMITAYLFYHFNDLKLKNENKKVNKAKEIFIYQIENLIIDYITCLKRVN